MPERLGIRPTITFLGENAVAELLEQWYDRDALEERIARDDAPMFVAVGDSEVIGFTQGMQSEDNPADAVVGSIYVLPERWGEGIGTELLHQLFAAFQEQSWNSVCLAVMAENDGTRSSMISTASRFTRNGRSNSPAKRSTTWYWYDAYRRT